jgi:hypothetical protein
MPVVILVEGTVEVMPEVEEVVAASSREVVKEAVLVVAADAAAMDAVAMAPAQMDLEVVDAVMVAQVMVDRVGEETAVALAVRVASVATTPVGNRPKHALGRPQTSKP